MNLIDIFNSINNKEEKDEIKISYYVIKYCNDNNIEITNLKLIKLLYFINIEYMIKNNGEPIFEEEFIAWRHGPVLQSVYDYFCFGIVLPSEEKLNKLFNDLSKEKRNIIDKVLLEKANLSAWDLVEETHIINGPWDIVYKKNKDKDGICKEKIKNEDIYNFYKEYNG